MSELGVETTNRGNWMSTYTGRRYFPFDPDPDDIVIKDIAVGLSNEARFGGQCRFFSVAEHSVNVSYMVPDRHKLAALLHDAPEAYIGDIPRPLKTIPEFAAVYKPLEQKNWEAVAKRFDLQGLGDGFQMPEVIHWADNLTLCNEARYLKHVHRTDWALIQEESELIFKIKGAFKEEGEVFEYDDDIPPDCFTPQEAAEVFLNRFAELTRLDMVSRETSGAPVINIK